MSNTVYLDQCLWSGISGGEDVYKDIAPALHRLCALKRIDTPISWPMVLETVNRVKIDGSNNNKISRHISIMTSLSRGVVFRNALRVDEPVNFETSASFKMTFTSRDSMAMFGSKETEERVLDAMERTYPMEDTSRANPEGRLFHAIAVTAGTENIIQEVANVIDVRRMQLQKAVDEYRESTRDVGVDSWPTRQLRNTMAVLPATLSAYADSGRNVLSRKNRGDALDFEHRLYAINCDYACMDEHSASMLEKAGMDPDAVFNTTPDGLERFRRFLQSL